MKRYAAPRAPGALLASPLLLLLVLACSGAAASPRTGDHWHASYTISICGREQPPLPEFQGGVHTHGDGVIHVHPTLPSEEGEGARLVQFFANAGGVLGERSLELPGDRPWRDGSICAGGRPGRVVVIVNQGPLGKDLDTYVPRDGDRILIAFVPAGSPPPEVPPPHTPAID